MRLIWRAGLMLLWILATPCRASAWPLMLEFSHWPDSAIIEPSDDMERRALALSYRRDQATIFRYAHEPLLVRIGDPAHNGYLHQWGVETRRTAERWRLQLEAGLHGSSNMFKYQRLHREALVGRFDWHWDGSAQSLGWLGISGDYRFGGFRLYPSMDRRLALPGATELHLRLPQALIWQAGDERWQLGLRRYGQKWGALDASRQVKSAVYLQEWQLEGRWQAWQTGRFMLELGAGISFDSRLSHTDLQAGRQTLRLEDAAYLTLRLHGR